MKKLIFMVCICSAAWISACSKMLDDAEYAPDIKLGAKEKTVECGRTCGECSFDVVANCDFSASIIKGAEWLSFIENEGATVMGLSGNTTLSLSYTSNRGYRRSGALVLNAGNRSDTLTVRQFGSYAQEVLSDTDYLSVPGEGGSYSVGITTNLLRKDFRFETVDTTKNHYPLNGKADKFRYSDGMFSFRVLASESRDDKVFIVRIYTLDDWGDKVGADIIINQKAGRE